MCSQFALTIDGVRGIVKVHAESPSALCDAVVVVEQALAGAPEHVVARGVPCWRCRAPLGLIDPRQSVPKCSACFVDVSHVVPSNEPREISAAALFGALTKSM